MSFELLPFPRREMIKLAIHILHVSKRNPFIYRKRIFCVMLHACIVYIDIAKLPMRFLHYAFCLAKNHVSVPFFWAIFSRIERNVLLSPLQKTEILPICFCVFHTKMIKNIIFNSTKTLVYVSSFICGLYVYASFHCIGSSGFKIIWRAYLGECPGIEDGRHFRGNEPQGKRVFCFFILIIIHLQ